LGRKDAIPFPAAEPYVPSAYIDLTTQELCDEYGVALGDSIAPSNVVAATFTNGLLKI
jgi:hypothetical protein